MALNNEESNAADQMSDVNPDSNHKLRPLVTLACALNGELAIGGRYAELSITFGVYFISLI